MSTEPNRAETCNIASALVRQAEQQGQNIAIHYPVGKRGPHTLRVRHLFSAE